MKATSMYQALGHTRALCSTRRPGNMMPDQQQDPLLPRPADACCLLMRMAIMYDGALAGSVLAVRRIPRPRFAGYSPCMVTTSRRPLARSLCSHSHTPCTRKQARSATSSVLTVHGRLLGDASMQASRQGTRFAAREAAAATAAALLCMVEAGTLINIAGHQDLSTQ